MTLGSSGDTSPLIAKRVIFVSTVLKSSSSDGVPIIPQVSPPVYTIIHRRREEI